MPLYEYDCPNCGRFEALQRISDSPFRKHEACGAKVRRLMSAGSFAFKGSGFYATDYGKKKSEPGKSDSGKSDPGTSDSGKSDPGKSDPGKSEPGRSDPGKKDAAPAKPKAEASGSATSKAEA